MSDAALESVRLITSAQPVVSGCMANRSGAVCALPSQFGYNLLIGALARQSVLAQRTTVTAPDARDVTMPSKVRVSG